MPKFRNFAAFMRRCEAQPVPTRARRRLRARRRHEQLAQADWGDGDCAASMGADPQLLTEVPIFSLLDEKERATLAERVETVTFAAGTVLFNRGDPGDSLYVVRSGAVELFFKNDTGERIVLDTVTPGHFFGEISLLDGGPRTASAVAIQDVEARGRRSRGLGGADSLAAGRRDGAAVRDRPPLARDERKAASHRVAQRERRDRGQAQPGDEDRRLDLGVQRQPATSCSSTSPCSSCGSCSTRGRLSRIWRTFDPFPYGLLTMCVSLEAIILSVFVLLSQSRQVARDRVRNDIEYDVNLKAELEIAHLHEKFDHLHVELLQRLNNIERHSKRPPGP